MTDPLLDNRSRVCAGKTIHARRCDRCGTFADVTKSWCVPLTEGGERTEWNVSTMCGSCRAERATETLTGNSTIYPNGGWDRRGRVNESDGAPGHPGTAVAKGDRIFRTLSQAAREFGVSVTTVFRWVENGHNGWRRAGA